MADDIKRLTLEPGYLVITTESGGATRWPVSDVIRGADIPDHSATKVTTGELDKDVIPGYEEVVKVVGLLLKRLIANEAVGQDEIDIGATIKELEALGVEF